MSCTLYGTISCPLYATVSCTLYVAVSCPLYGAMHPLSQISPPVVWHFKWSSVPCLVECFVSHWAAWNSVIGNKSLLLLKSDSCVGHVRFFCSYLGIFHRWDFLLSPVWTGYLLGDKPLNNPVTCLNWFMPYSSLVILIYGSTIKLPACFYLDMDFSIVDSFYSSINCCENKCQHWTWNPITIIMIIFTNSGVAGVQ